MGTDVYEKPSFLDVNDLSARDELSVASPRFVIVFFLVAAVLYTVAGGFVVVAVATLEAVAAVTSLAAVQTATVSAQTWG